MKKIFAVIILMLIFALVLIGCSKVELPSENGAQSSEEDYRCEGDCVVIDEIPEEKPASGEISEEEKPQEHQEKPTFEDMDSIYLFDEDGSPLVAMTEEEREEFLEIIGSYELTEITEADPAIGTTDKNITFKSKEKGAVLYSKELAGEGLLSFRWNDWQNSLLYDVSGDLYYDLEDLRHQIQKNARSDGRWPFLSFAEEPYTYSDNPPAFDEEHFLKELDTFIFCVPGEFSIEQNRLTPEKAGLYCVVKTLRDNNAAGKTLPYNSDGQVLVPEDEVCRVAKYVFGIAEYSDYASADDGYYTVPFGLPILRYKIESIETDGAYVICTVLFHDPDDSEFEWEPYCKKVYRFSRFAVDGETWYRPVSAYYEFGGEYGF